MAGAPTKLTPELVERARDYLSGGFQVNEECVPSIEGLAVYLKLSRQSIYNYKDASSEFLDIVELIEAKQAMLLINKGLSGDFNGSIAKLMLTKHGYNDKQGIELTGANGGAIETSLTITFTDDHD